MWTSMEWSRSVVRGNVVPGKGSGLSSGQETQKGLLSAVRKRSDRNLVCRTKSITVSAPMHCMLSCSSLVHLMVPSDSIRFRCPQGPKARTEISCVELKASSSVYARPNWSPAPPTKKTFP